MPASGHPHPTDPWHPLPARAIPVRSMVVIAARMTNTAERDPSCPSSHPGGAAANSHVTPGGATLLNRATPHTSRDRGCYGGLPGPVLCSHRAPGVQPRPRRVSPVRARGQAGFRPCDAGPAMGMPGIGLPVLDRAHRGSGWTGRLGNATRQLELRCVRDGHRHTITRP